MMKNAYQPTRVVKNVALTEEVYWLTLKPTQASFQAEPGQFCMLKINRPGLFLPRPLSVCDLTQEGIHFLYLVAGKGTAALTQLKPGDSMEVLADLGQGFPIAAKSQKVALVAGGIGLAPMYYLAKRLKQAGKQVDLYVGFSKTPYLVEDFVAIVDQVYIASDHGQVGHHGLVTDLVQDAYDTLYACGPEAMFQTLSQMSLQADQYYSMERHMACGVGACLGCSLPTPTCRKRVCQDGPVFNREEVGADAWR